MKMMTSVLYLGSMKIGGLAPMGFSFFIEEKNQNGGILVGSDANMV